MARPFNTPRMNRSGSIKAADKPDWTHPGYFTGKSKVTDTMRVIVQLVRPPKGHRTIPTKTGAMFIFITIGVGTAAFNTGQNILYLTLSMLLSTLLVSGVLSWLNFKGCRWRLRTGRHFRVGEASPVYLELQNMKRALPSYDLTFRLVAALGGTARSLRLRERLDPGRQVDLLWEFTPSRRGKETISLHGMLSQYPFGFLKKTIRDSCEREITVWPARIPYQFSGDKSGTRWLYGRHRRKGDGVELVHLRDYRSGDSMKRIHWRASARMGSLQVRETVQEHHQAFSLHVDPSPHIWGDPAQFETMCSFAASLAEDLYQRDQLESVRIAGRGVRLVGGIEDLYSIFDTLSGLERKRAGSDEAANRNPADTVTFRPGRNGAVLAYMENRHAGQA